MDKTVEVKPAEDGRTKELLKLLCNDPLELVVYAKLAPVVEVLGESQPGFHRDVLAQAERALLRLVMERTGGNQRRAAGMLGMSRNTLRSRLSLLRVEVERNA